LSCLYCIKNQSIITGFKIVLWRRLSDETNYMHNSKYHIGEIIKAEVIRKGIKVSWLAAQLNCHRNNVYLIFSRRWIDTDMLMKISRILEHDFFADLSAWYHGEEMQSNDNEK